MRGIRACLCACSTLSLIVGTASPAFAQDASDGTVQQRADTSGARSPTEIVVTAQKRVERIQDVPIAISAFSGEALAAQKVEGGFDLMKAVPRSEEHTSELQSLMRISYAVFCLKKKTDYDTYLDPYPQSGSSYIMTTNHYSTLNSTLY